MKYCKALLLSIINLSVALSVSASSIREEIPDSQYLDFGNNEGDFVYNPLTQATPDFSGVGYVKNIFTGQSGSGILISPEWVLTAASVIQTLDESNDPNEDPSVSEPIANNIRVFFGKGGVNGDFFKLVSVEEVYVHPAWTAALLWAEDDQQLLTQGVDIALLKLTEPVVDILNYPINTKPEAYELGQFPFISGYGYYANGKVGLIENDKFKRSLQNTIDRILNIQVEVPGYESLVGGQLAIDFDPSLDLTINEGLRDNTLNGTPAAPQPGELDMRYLGDGNSNEIPTNYEGLPILGDAGGPWLVRFSGQGWLVAGVTSFDNASNGLYGGIAVATSVANYADWIIPKLIEDVIPDSFAAGNGWYYREGFGFYNPETLPWIYQAQRGFLYVEPGQNIDDENGIWMWSQDLDAWLWTRGDVLPFAWRGDLSFTVIEWES